MAIVSPHADRRLTELSEKLLALNMGRPYRVGFDARTAKIPGATKWRMYDGGTALHHLRTVLPCEIVFDVGDNSPWHRTVRDANTIMETLSGLNLEFWVSLSGGSGIHIHLFGPAESEALPGGVDWRNGAASRIIQLAHDKRGPHAWYNDALDVDYRTISPRADSRLVREHGSTKPETGQRKMVWPGGKLPFTRDAAYLIAQRGPIYPDDPALTDADRLDMSWVRHAFGNVSCPISDECREAIGLCNNCPVNA